MQHIATALGLALTNSLLACGPPAVSPAVVRQTAATGGAIRAAEEVGAEREPEAALHLKLAREGIAQAWRWISDGEDEAARRALERADVDAELALALARGAELRAAAISAKAQIEQMRS